MRASFLDMDDLQPPTLAAGLSSVEEFFRIFPTLDITRIDLHTAVVNAIEHLEGLMEICCHSQHLGLASNCGSWNIERNATSLYVQALQHLHATSRHRLARGYDLGGPRGLIGLDTIRKRLVRIELYSDDGCVLLR